MMLLCGPSQRLLPVPAWLLRHLYLTQLPDEDTRHRAPAQQLLALRRRVLGSLVTLQVHWVPPLLRPDLIMLLTVPLALRNIQLKTLHI